MGGLLRHIADRLAHGQWMRWVAEAVPGIEHRTINRYIALSVFADLYPDEFKNLRTLSLPKLYALVGTTPKIRRSLYGRAVAIPGTDLRLTLALMSAAQLARVIAKFRGVDREDPSDEIIGSLLRSMAGMRRQMNALREQSSNVDRKAAARLQREFAQFAEEIRTFKL
jgi:hypothetical protein